MPNLTASVHRDSMRRLARHLPAFRRRLEEDHGFRVTQLRALEEEASLRSGDDGLNDEILIALHTAASSALAAIDAALDRLDAGDFGCCNGCGKALAVARLQVLPMVELCLECQRAAEVRRR